MVEAFLAAGLIEAANGRCINLGGLRPVSHLELIHTLVETAGCGDWRLVPFPAEFRKIDIGDVYSTRDLADEVLGWRPAVDLAEGLARTVAYYRAHRDEYWT